MLKNEEAATVSALIGIAALMFWALNASFHIRGGGLRLAYFRPHPAATHTTLQYPREISRLVAPRSLQKKLNGLGVALVAIDQS